MEAAQTTRLGFALEGGGAKGAYHMGVVKAYLEAGHIIGAVTGTSIGALNGAVIAQGSFEEGCTLWERLNLQSVFDINDEEHSLLLQRRLSRSALRHLATRTRHMIANGGMDTRKMRGIIESVIREDQLRSSAIEFGLVTVSLSDRTPLELFTEDIPQGQIVDYLMASASFPGFKSTVIDNKAFIDGGLYDNCPINMLARKGYTQIVAVRTLGPGFTRKLEYPDVSVTQIVPSGHLGGLMNFSPDLIRRNMKMGYYDALRHLKGLQGTVYCIDAGDLSEAASVRLLTSIGDDSMLRLGRMLGFGSAPPEELWDRYMMPKLAGRMRLSAGFTLPDFFIRLAETLAEAKAVDKFAVYSFPDFIEAARSGPLKGGKGLDFAKVEVCMAAQRIFDAAQWTG